MRRRSRTECREVRLGRHWAVTPCSARQQIGLVLTNEELAQVYHAVITRATSKAIADNDSAERGIERVRRAAHA